MVEVEASQWHLSGTAHVSTNILSSFIIINVVQSYYFTYQQELLAGGSVAG